MTDAKNAVNTADWTVSDWLQAYVGSANKAADIQAKLAETRTGPYACLTNAAIVAGSEERFLTDAESFEADIKANVDNMAVSLGCKPNKAKKGEDITYKMPSSWKVAKSVLKAALSLGVSLTDDDDGETPKSFTAIRDAVRQIQEANKLATGPEWLRVHAEILATVDKAVSRMAKLAESKEMSDHQKTASLNVIQRYADNLLNHARAQFNIDAMRADAKAKKAEKAETAPASEAIEDETPAVPEEVIRITDKARELAGNKLELSSIEGTGKNGTITVADVRKALAA